MASKNKNKQDFGVGFVVDNGELRRIHDKRELQRIVVDHWGASENDHTVGKRVKFDPARDILWNRNTAAKERAFMQAERLRSFGIPVGYGKTYHGVPFSDPVDMTIDGKRVSVSQDLMLLAELAEGQGKHAGKIKGFTSLFDAAPDLFVAQELVKLSGEIVYEDFVELTAREYLPFTDYNTYLQVYAWDQISRNGPATSTIVNVQDLSNLPRNRRDVQRAQKFGSLLHHFDSAYWTDLELLIYAEARQNGAPDVDIVRIRIEEARRAMLRTENLLAYFGWPVQGAGVQNPIYGLLTHPDIDHNPALAFGVNSEQDVDVILGPIKDNFAATKGIEAYDTIIVGHDVWAYLNTTDYKSVNSDSTETVAEVLMRKASQFGVRQMVYAAELTFDAEELANLEDEHGWSTAQATQWAGGYNGESAIALIKKDAAKGSVARGKDIAALPQETVHGSHEAQFLMSSGGFDVKKPKAFQILTGVTGI